MTNISSNKKAASIQKYVETSNIKIEINHGNSILLLFYYGLAIHVALFYPERMRNKWQACGKTMIKYSILDLFLNYMYVKHCLRKIFNMKMKIIFFRFCDLNIVL